MRNLRAEGVAPRCLLLTRGCFIGNITSLFRGWRANHPNVLRRLTVPRTLSDGQEHDQLEPVLARG